jgi:hypothetical protein
VPTFFSRPLAGELSIVGTCLDHGREEFLNFLTDVLQCYLLYVVFVLFAKCGPLLLFVFIAEEFSSKNQRLASRQLRATTFEGARHSIGYNSTLEWKFSRQNSKVMEVFHPAIRHTKAHQRLEFLCDHTLARICEELGRRQFEQRG